MVTAPRVFVNGIEADPAFIMLPLSISHGRSNPDSQPDAPQATLMWLGVEHAPKHGDELRIEAAVSAGGAPPTYDDPLVAYDDPRVSYGGAWLSTRQRFAGVVQDVTTYEYAGLTTQVQVVAISEQASLGRRAVQLDRPSEDDVTRVQAICAAAGVVVEIAGNPGIEPLIPQLIDSDALSALHTICTTTGGLIWTDTAGVLHYGTGDHRALAEPAAVLPAAGIVSGIEWQASLSGLINRVTVQYGPQEAQGETTVTDDLSLSLYDLRDSSVTSLLTEQGAADQLAALILARRAWPFARITDVLIDSDYSESLTVDTALTLRVSDAVLLPIPPDPGPTGLLAEWIIEGWQEEWDRPDRVSLQIAVSDRARFADTRLRLWSHAAAVTWLDELTRGAWLDALILQPGEGEAAS